MTTSTPTSRPTRRSLDYASFDELLADLRQMREHGATTVGQWTLGQICDHLDGFMRKSMEGFDFGVPWPLRLVGPLRRRRTLRTRRLPSGAKGPPALMPRSSNELDDREAVDRLIGTIERYRAHTAPLHPSPLLGRMDRAVGPDPPDSRRASPELCGAECARPSVAGSRRDRGLPGHRFDELKRPRGQGRCFTCLDRTTQPVLRPRLVGCHRCLHL